MAPPRENISWPLMKILIIRPSSYFWSPQEIPNIHILYFLASPLTHRDSAAVASKAGTDSDDYHHHHHHDHHDHHCPHHPHHCPRHHPHHHRKLSGTMRNMVCLKHFDCVFFFQNKFIHIGVNDQFKPFQVHAEWYTAPFWSCVFREN